MVVSRTASQNESIWGKVPLKMSLLFGVKYLLTVVMLTVVVLTVLTVVAYKY